MARFVDKQGNLITGDVDALTQYNLEERYPRHRGRLSSLPCGGGLPFDCARCHTTGYIAEGNQDDLPGLIGVWVEDGVGCENCHGRAAIMSTHPIRYRCRLCVANERAAPVTAAPR